MRKIVSLADLSVERESCERLVVLHPFSLANTLWHWLTPDRVKPLRKKIQGILDMQEPKDISKLCSFFGMVTYYRDMWS